MVGHRDVRYCDDVVSENTMCSSRNTLARTVFIGASNSNITTNRLSSEIYPRIQDMLNWTSGEYSSSKEWDALNEVIAGDISRLNLPNTESNYQGGKKGPSPSSSEMVSCSHKAIYLNMAALVERIIKSSATLLNSREITALAHMLNVVDSQEAQELREVVKSKAILDESLERELSTIMLMLARCSSLAWASKGQCPPSVETVVVTSKYPRPVNSEETGDAVHVYVAVDDVIISEDVDLESQDDGFRGTSGPASPSTGRHVESFDWKREVLDTLVLNLHSNVRC